MYFKWNIVNLSENGIALERRKFNEDNEQIGLMWGRFYEASSNGVNEMIEDEVPQKIIDTAKVYWGIDK